MLKSISEVGGNRVYNSTKRLYNIQFEADQGRALLTGCTGGEIDPKVVLSLIRSGDWAVEVDARGQVAAGMELISKQDETPTIGLLLGDQVYPDGVPEDPIKAVKVLEEEIFTPYQSIKANFYLLNGNHEVGSHGKKQKNREHLDQKAQRHVDAIQQANKSNFSMPANYYAQILRGRSNKVLACFIYGDTNSLPYDADQQAWLMQTIGEFDKADAAAPWFWAGHHALVDSVDKRGLKGDGGKYGAPKEQHNSNHHQQIFATLQKIGFPIKRLTAVFAAHAHTNYIAINDQSPALPDQYIIGGGGSWSNSEEQVALPVGIKWSACTFGFCEMQLTRDKVSIVFWDCSNVKLKSPSISQLNSPFATEMRRDDRVVRIIRNNGLDPILQKQFKKSLALLNHAVRDSSSSLALKMACYLWGHVFKELNQLMHELNKRGRATNSMMTLLLMPVATEHAVVSPTELLQTLEQCLLLFAIPVQERFLGIKPYKQLFAALQVCHFCLATSLSQTLEATSISTSDDLSIRRFKRENYKFLRDDDSDEESDVDIEADANELAEDRSLFVSTEEVDSIIDTLCKKSLSAGVLKGTEELQKKLATFLQEFVADSALLRTMITTAAKQRLEYLYNEYQTKFHHKKLESKQFFYFIAREDAQVARAYATDFFLNRIPPNILIKAVMATDVDPSADLSGMILLHLANAFVYMLNKERLNGGENAAYVENIFQSWASRHGDEFDSFEEEDRWRQRSQECLRDYFINLQLNASNQIYATFLDKKCVQALWSGESAWESEFQKHFKIDQAKIDAYTAWQALPKPTLAQSMWNYTTSFIWGKDEKVALAVTTSTSNPLHP